MPFMSASANPDSSVQKVVHLEGTARQCRNQTLCLEATIEVCSGEATFECGGSRHRFPVTPHAANVQLREQLSLSPFGESDAE